MCDRVLWKLCSPFLNSNGSVKALFCVGESKSLAILCEKVAKKAQV